jgi:carboxymethylenebutenolidase
MGEFEALEVGEATTRLYVAGDARQGTPGVVVFHPWWGLNDDVVAYADRLAAAGFVVAAPDMFDGNVVSTIEEAEQLTKAADEEAINAIALASVDRLARGVGPTARLAGLGFSFGAHWAMWIPAERDQVVASILYYGTTGGPVLTSSSAPVLGHFAADDPFETADWVAEFTETLKSAGRDVVINTYPGTGHWFAEPSRDAYRAEAANQAFERTVAFLRTHLGA